MTDSKGNIENSSVYVIKVIIVIFSQFICFELSKNLMIFMNKLYNTDEHMNLPSTSLLIFFCNRYLLTVYSHKRYMYNNNCNERMWNEKRNNSRPMPHKKD